MSPEGNVLLGALLDRLGKTEAQLLLARLDRWMTRERDKVHTQESRFDRDQGPETQAPYDRRRKGDGNEIYQQPSNAAS